MPTAWLYSGIQREIRYCRNEKRGSTASENQQLIPNTLIRVARQVFEMLANLAPQTGDFLRQDDAEFGDQSTETVVERSTFFDKPLPAAVQTQDDLLVPLS